VNGVDSSENNAIVNTADPHLTISADVIAVSSGETNVTEGPTTLGGGIAVCFWPAMGRSAPVLHCLARRSCRAFYPEFAPGEVIFFGPEARLRSRGYMCPKGWETVTRGGVPDARERDLTTDGHG